MTQEVIQASALDFGRDAFECCDTLIVDPPYSVEVHTQAVSVGTAASNKRKGVPSTEPGAGVPLHARDLGFASLSPELRESIALASACVKRWSLIYTDQESTHLWREACDAHGTEYIRTMPWIRWSQPQLSGDRPPTGVESVLIFHHQHVGPKGGRKPVAKSWNGPGSLTHFEECAMRGKEKHPTQKPLDLLLSQVSYFSDPGETILDLTCGSGTTLVAAKLLGRAAIGIEQDPKWVRLANSRLKVLEERDVLRAKKWCDAVEEEAQVQASAPPTSENHNTIRRAKARLDDVAEVRRHIQPGCY